MGLLLLFCFCLCLCPIRSLKTQKKSTSTNTKAASFRVSCDCQCSSLSSQDSWGKSHGNCKSADDTGSLWCYVDDNNSNCQDLAYSSRGYSNAAYRNKRWSYQACDTPTLNSPQCQGYGGGSNNVGYNTGYNNGGSSGVYNNGGYNNGGGYG